MAKKHAFLTQMENFHRCFLDLFQNLVENGGNLPQKRIEIPISGGEKMGLDRSSPGIEILRINTRLLGI